MNESYDVVIVGGGHDGLACAAYLARSGLKVKVLEARSIVRGAAVTEEFAPGFRNSSCSYVVSLLHPQIQKDLELARHGLSILALKQDITVPTEEGRWFGVGPDRATMIKQLDEFAAGDGAAYERFELLLSEVADILRGLTLQAPPNLMGGWKDALQAAWRPRDVRKLSSEARLFFAQLMTMSAHRGVAF